MQDQPALAFKMYNGLSCFHHQFSIVKAGNMSNLVKHYTNSTFETALAVLEHGWATIDQLRGANHWRLAQASKIGKLALVKGKLTMAQVFTVLAEQDCRGKMFGETAVELGYLTYQDVYELLLEQANGIPNLLDALVTQNVISPHQAALIEKEATALDADLVAEINFVETALN
ncbi:MAG: hypothetical protein SFX18_11775 [Pirellulales bacterium]|nr:hypothetical protein [Pirellulales bacterium]